MTDARSAAAAQAEATRLLTAALRRSLKRRDRAGVDETGMVATMRGATPGVMVDVGAHHGTALQYFAARGWTVHAFEPDPANRAVLERDHGTNPAVHIDPRAVSDVGGQELTYYASDVSTGISGLHAFHDSHRPVAMVTTTTLGDVCRDRGLERIDFLKIDTEGHDLFVLRGLDWDAVHPAVVECEFEDSKTVPLGYDVHDLARFLLDRGYTVWLSEWHPVVRYGTAHDWRGIAPYPLRPARGSWGNLLAFADPPDLREIATGVAHHLRSRA